MTSATGKKMTSRDGEEMEIPKSALERDSILKMVFFVLRETSNSNYIRFLEVWGSLFPTSFFLSLEFVHETTPKRILLCFAVFYVITAGIFPLSRNFFPKNICCIIFFSFYPQNLRPFHTNS